jgi:hypothetical protein
MSDTTFQFMRACTNALESGKANQINDIEEHEATGISVGKKLQRMDPLQAIYAESLINAVLKRGLLKSLGPNTDLCDKQCNYFQQCPTITVPQASVKSTSSPTSFINLDSSNESIGPQPKFVNVGELSDCATDF